MKWDDKNHSLKRIKKMKPIKPIKPIKFVSGYVKTSGTYVRSYMKGTKMPNL